MTFYEKSNSRKKNFFKTNNNLSKSSAQRGTSMIDRIEDKASAPIITKRNPESLMEVSVREKLNQLLQKFPANSFYQSLFRWKGKFNPKQIESIEKNYDSSFRIEKVIAEHKADESELDPDWRPWKD